MKGTGEITTMKCCGFANKHPSGHWIIEKSCYTENGVPIPQQLIGQIVEEQIFHWVELVGNPFKLQ